MIKYYLGNKWKCNERISEGLFFLWEGAGIPQCLLTFSGICGYQYFHLIELAIQMVESIDPWLNYFDRFNIMNIA
jgi:hypothetical protein